MAKLNVQKLKLSGTNPTFSNASSGGDTFYNNGKTILHVKNSDTVAHTVTVNSQTPCNFGFDHDVAVTISAGSSVQIGTFEKGRFNDIDDLTHITYDAITGMTVAVVTTE